MATVVETPLPGIGVRYEFTTDSGDRLGVIVHRSGRRDLLVYDRDDPDSCRAVRALDDDDARTLVDLLGGSEVAERLDLALRQSVEGLVLEWVELGRDALAAGRTLAEIGLRKRTGASVVAVVRGGETVPSPRADFRLEVGDTAVVVGSADAIMEALELLRRG